jgi:hypothetical protein
MLNFDYQLNSKAKMNLLEFNDYFPTEESCQLHMRKGREGAGITCKRCGGTKHYWVNSLLRWECAGCKACMTLKSGTIMEKSHLPLRIWYMGIHLMTATKKNISALEMQRQTKWKRYEPIWYMMHKIRASMGKRDSRYQLKNAVEADDAFFEVVDLERDKDKGLKRGRGSEKQASVLIMVESAPNPSQDKVYKKDRVIGYAKMLVMNKLKAKDIDQEVELAIHPESTVLTDGYKGYAGLHDIVSDHVPMIVLPKEASIMLPWAHTVISNAKRGLLGIHHSIGKEYLQNYLSEFCYKLNRRYFKADLFDRAIVAAISDVWY